MLAARRRPFAKEVTRMAAKKKGPGKGTEKAKQKPVKVDDLGVELSPKERDSVKGGANGKGPERH
jgi:hypothetical protein